MKRILTLAVTLLFAALLPTAAFADMGPKPSVRISIEGLDPYTACYGTLLSEKPSTGPATAYDGTNQYLGMNDEAIWRAFVDYSDPDGYYFLQELWQCNTDGKLWWGYYPPEDFKLLLYFPDTGEFVSSGKYSAYAFSSYFDAELTDGGVTLRRSYDYGYAALGFFVRCVFTIALEIAIAYFLFKLRSKRPLTAVALINTVTQAALNLAVNIIVYLKGSFLLVPRFLLMELAVFVAEAVLYDMAFRRAGAQLPMRRCWALSAVGSAASYALGLALAYVIPGVF